MLAVTFDGRLSILTMFLDMKRASGHDLPSSACDSPLVVDKEVKCGC